LLFDNYLREVTPGKSVQTPRQICDTEAFLVTIGRWLREKWRSSRFTPAC